MSARGTNRHLSAVWTALLPLLAACSGKTEAIEAPPPTVPMVRPAGGEAPRLPQAKGEEPADEPTPPTGPKSTGGAGQSGLPSVTAFDFVANRLLAHLRIDGGLYVPMGSQGSLKYTQGTWRSAWYPRQKIDGVMAAETDGVQGTLRVPLDAGACEGGCSLVLRVKPFGEEQRLDVFVNEHGHRTVDLQAGFQTLRLDVEPSEVVPGENKLRLQLRRSATVGSHRTAAAVEYVALLKKGGDASDPRVPVSLVKKAGDDEALDGSAFTDIRYYLTVPRDAALSFRPEATVDGARFKVVVTDAADGHERVLMEGAADGKPRRADLADLENEAVRLSFVASDGGVLWARPQIVVPKPPAVERPKPVRNVIIWLVDTLRADRLHAYNPASRVKTPNIDRLVREGVVFRSTTVQGGHSIPSHASLLTGLYPTTHGHMSADTKLTPEQELLSEVFEAAGFATALFSSNGYVSSKWGFRQGFQVYKNYIRDEEPAHTAHMLEDVLPYLAAHKDDRIFAYLATVDPHVAYRWRDRISTEYDPEPYSGPVGRNITGNFLNRIQSGGITLNERDKARLIATYDGEVTYNDEQLGRLLDRLSKLGILDETLIVIASDHGEQLFEHDGVGHGGKLYQVLVSVPLILWRPGTLPEGRVVEGDVEIIDVMATLLSLAGLETADRVQGDDLAALATGAAPDLPRPAFAERADVGRSLKIGRWKYILRGGDNDDLFDLDSDPAESKDVKTVSPVAHRYMRDVMAFWLSYNDTWSKRRWGVPSNQAPGFAESVE